MRNTSSDDEHRWFAIARFEHAGELDLDNFVSDEPARYRLERTATSEPLTHWEVLIDPTLEEPKARRLAATVLLALKLHALDQGAEQFRIIAGAELLDELRESHAPIG